MDACVRLFLRYYLVQYSQETDSNVWSCIDESDDPLVTLAHCWVNAVIVRDAELDIEGEVSTIRAYFVSV